MDGRNNTKIHPLVVIGQCIFKNCTNYSVSAFAKVLLLHTHFMWLFVSLSLSDRGEKEFIYTRHAQRFNAVELYIQNLANETVNSLKFKKRNLSQRNYYFHGWAI